MTGIGCAIGSRALVLVGLVGVRCPVGFGLGSGDGVETRLDQLLDGILQQRKISPLFLGKKPINRTLYLLVTEILAAERCLQTLADLFPGDGREIGRFENAVDDGGVSRVLFGGHYSAC